MDIIQITTIGIVSTILALTLKKQSSEISILISIAAGILIFLIIVPKLTALMGVLRDLATAVDSDLTYLSVILKIIGIAYIAQFGTSVCSDAGEAAIASKIELAGKVMIMVVSAPIMLALVDMIVGVLP